jgi:high affinity sulfate transporter 1
MTTVGAPERPSLAGRARAGLLAVPAVRLVRTYQRDWLRADGLAALTVWALLVPQALAYASLGGFDPVVGLYASVGALLGYALFGGVRELSVGPEATIALLTATVIAPLAGGDPVRYLALGAGVALVAGVLLVLAGIARLGFVTRYLSRPLLTGYVAGSAVVMIVSQLDSLLGVTIQAKDDTLAELTQTIQAIPETDLLTLAVGLAVIAIALVVRRIDKRLPAYLVAVLAAIVASVILDLEAQGVTVVGSIPPGLPPFGPPALSLADIGQLFIPAAAVGLLIYADSGVSGQVLARRGGYRVDGNGEFIGLGAANIGASLTGGFPVNGSQSRSFTSADMGVRSQLASIGVVALVLVTLLFLTPLFEPLPKAALAGVIIVVAMGLLDPSEFVRLARISRLEAGLAVWATVIVVAVGMLAGVVIIAIMSLLIVAQRAARPRTTLLVRLPGTDTFRGADSTPDGTNEPGIVLYRFDAPLFFANAEVLRDDVAEAIATADPPARWVVVDMEAVSDVDSTAAEMLLELADDLRHQHMGLALARLKGPVAAYLERAGLFDAIDHDRIYLEVDDAVLALRVAEPPAGEPPAAAGGSAT